MIRYPLQLTIVCHRGWVQVHPVHIGLPIFVKSNVQLKKNWGMGIKKFVGAHGSLLVQISEYLIFLHQRMGLK